MCHVVNPQDQSFTKAIAQNFQACNAIGLAAHYLRSYYLLLKKEKMILQASKELEVRFSEVDSMNVVWHGSYALYFEDAREAFGAKYGLEYLTIADNGYYAPLVELTFKYRQPIVYGMKCRIDIFYVPTEAAKIVFDYEIRRTEDNALMATGHSVQAFMNKQYQLEWYRPPFYQEWQERWKVSSKEVSSKE